MPPATIMNGSSNAGLVSKEDDTKYVAMDVIIKFVFSMALKAAVELRIPDILSKSEGGKPLTAEEILAQLPLKSSQPGPDSVRNLVCTLKPLVMEGFFTTSFNDKQQPVYGLTKVSEWFVSDNTLSLLPIVEFTFREETLGCWTQISKSILDDNSVPFVEHMGMTGYEYAAKNPDFGRRFQAAMVSFSDMEGPTVMDSLKISGVLEGVETLVDVGGGTGSNVAKIIAQNPHIKGINYDLPYVIAEAPEVKGLTSVAGSMFESVPAGDAMFVKWVIHNYGDNDAVKVLKNCFEALPKKGKVIIVEYVLLDDKDNSPKAKMGVFLNVTQQMFMKGARERTKAGYENIITAAGFSSPEFFQYPGSMDLIVAVKE